MKLTEKCISGAVVCRFLFPMSNELPVLFQRIEQGLDRTFLSTGNQDFVKTLQFSQEKSVLIQNVV